MHRSTVEELQSETYGLTQYDQCDGRLLHHPSTGQQQLSLPQLTEVLRDAYCGTATAEFMHLPVSV